MTSNSPQVGYDYFEIFRLNEAKSFNVSMLNNGCPLPASTFSFGIIGIWRFEFEVSARALDLECCVSVLSHGWTVYEGIKAYPCSYGRFLGLGTLTANWPRNEKLHSTNDRQRQNEIST